MIEPRLEIQTASDGYPIHVVVWPANGPTQGRVVVIHGVQSHAGWYQGLGRILAEQGFETHFPDRRGSGANVQDRGHTPSARRLIDDVAERLEMLRESNPALTLSLVGISWGGKTAVVTAADHPQLVDALALICPGLAPRVGVSFKERLRIAWAFFTNRRKTFLIPLSNPALFTSSSSGQQFIAADHLSLRSATAGLLAASTFLDRWVRRSPSHVNQPALMMIATEDRIVNNAKTLRYFERLASTEKEVIEYPGAHHTLEFEPDPKRYAYDLAHWLHAHTRSP